MSDLVQLDLFFEVWKQALGPSPVDPSLNGTEGWLHGFGTQTKWLTGESWDWWLERFSPPHDIDLATAQNFVSLVIGMLGNRTDPQGQAVQYAREVVGYLEAQGA